MNQRNRSNDERQWVSLPGVPLERVRPHFWTFSVCFVATLIFYIFVHVVAADDPSWRQAPSLIMGDTTRAGLFWILGSPIMVEGVVMVFAALYRERKQREAREEGRAEANAAWEEWNRRRMETEANGEPFTEPPPSQRNGSSDS